MELPELPTFEQIFRIAPITTLILFVVALGFYVGWWSRGEVIKLLKEWLDDLRRK